MVDYNKLVYLGHVQPPDETSVRIDNSTADGIMNITVKQKKSKIMDMKLWWLVYRFQQNQFRTFWVPVNVNLED